MPSNLTRQPAVSGTFYPANPDVLKKSVQKYIDNGSDSQLLSRAIIAPHAGYVYSGPIAGSAFRCARNAGEKIDTVVLIGPCHRSRFTGIAVADCAFWATPLGRIPIHDPLRKEALSLPFVRCMDEPHREEHSLEVQLPFLQTIFPNVPILPAVAGNVSDAEMEEFIELFKDRQGVYLVISSDLSHYHEYEEAITLDRRTAQAIVRLEPAKIDYSDACGKSGINGLLLAARRNGWKASQIDLRNSGDTAGSRDRVVGYGAFSFN